MGIERKDLVRTIAERIRAVRLERFGDDIRMVAEEIGLPLRTWLNYERGVTMPAEVMLHFLVLTGTEPEWLLTGEGRVFRSFPS